MKRPAATKWWQIRAPSELVRELVAKCPQSSLAHTLFAFERLSAGDDRAADAALSQALKADAEWDAGSRGYARLIHVWLAARNPEGVTTEGHRMIAAQAVPLRQVMEIPGVTSRSNGSAGMDPRVSGMLDGWIDLCGAMTSIAVSQGRGGSDVMWLPGVTNGADWASDGTGQRPFVTAVQESRPHNVQLVPAGTVDGDAAECRRRASEPAFAFDSCVDVLASLTDGGHPKQRDRKCKGE